MHYRPFHTYSMRQAIEEGFILDVLRNYVTYATYYRLANANPEDPDLDVRKASAQLARFASLHPTNMDQRAEVIVEHFRAHTGHRIGARAKAMVVTRSRLHAVRTYLAIRSYVERKGYSDCRPLVAFSGTVADGGFDYTEASINGSVRPHCRSGSRTRPSTTRWPGGSERSRTSSTTCSSSRRSTRPGSTSRS
jgi:type I restriction enzyme R subunit